MTQRAPGLALSGGIGWLVVMQRAPGLAIASSLCLFPTLLYPRQYNGNHPGSQFFFGAFLSFFRHRCLVGMGDGNDPFLSSISFSRLSLLVPTLAGRVKICFPPSQILLIADICLLLLCFPHFFSVAFLSIFLCFPLLTFSPSASKIARLRCPMLMRTNAFRFHLFSS